MLAGSIDGRTKGKQLPFRFGKSPSLNSTRLNLDTALHTPCPVVPMVSRVQCGKSLSD